MSKHREAKLCPAVLNPSLIVLPWASSQPKPARKNTKTEGSERQEDVLGSGSESEEEEEEAPVASTSATPCPCFFSPEVSHICSDSHGDACDVCFSHNRTPSSQAVRLAPESSLLAALSFLSFSSLILFSSALSFPAWINYLRRNLFPSRRGLFAQRACSHSAISMPTAFPSLFFIDIGPRTYPSS